MSTLDSEPDSALTSWSCVSLSGGWNSRDSQYRTQKLDSICSTRALQCHCTIAVENLGQTLSQAGPVGLQCTPTSCNVHHVTVTEILVHLSFGSGS